MQNLSHFVHSDGSLSIGRECRVIREKYSWHFNRINKAGEVAATIRAGAFAWPGGYPLYFITHDCAALCFSCAKKEWRQIVYDFIHKCSTGWRIVACEVNWEDSELVCDHCSKRIESAYGETSPAIGGDK